MSKARQLADLGYVSPLKSGTAAYGGTADVITLTTGLNLSALTTGMEIRFRATAANTGATTINVDGIGAIEVLTVPQTAGTSIALPADYIRTAVDTSIRYDGTNWIASRELEIGSNANGTWRRFENGWQTCSHSIVTSSSGFVLWTFPAVFAPTAGGLCVGSADSGGGSLSITFNFTGAISIRVYAGSSAGLATTSARVFSEAKWI